MKKIIWPILLSSSLLLGCNGNSTVRTAGTTDDYRYVQGSVLALHQPITVSPGRARVFIQHGKALSGYNVNEYAVQCNFEIDTVDHDGFTIMPDNFVVQRVQFLIEEVVLANPRRLAALTLAMDERSGPSQAFEGDRKSVV